MKKNTGKWIKAALIFLLAAGLLYLTWSTAFLTKIAYSDWKVNRFSVQERLYEAVDMYFAYAQMLVLVAVLLILTIRCLIRTVKQPREPGKILRFLRQKGHYLAMGFVGLFILLFLLDRAVLTGITNTVETSEVPEALFGHILFGRLTIGAELDVIGAVISLVSWIRGRKERKHKRVESSSVPSGLGDSRTSMEDIQFSQMQTHGNHLYRREGEVAEIIFANNRTGFRKTIVDDAGRIADFPGFAHPELVSQYVGKPPSGLIRFYSHIERLDGQYALIWQIQPDGRYWEDDSGFGGTTDDEINLYAHIDEKGSFVEPFRLFSIGSNRFYGTDEEEKAAQTLAMREDPLSCLQKQIPVMLDELKEKIRIPETGSACYCIPGTIYQAELSLAQEAGKWYVKASVRKRMSNTSQIGFLKYLPLEEQREYLKTEKAKEDAIEKLMQLFYSIQRKG